MRSDDYNGTQPSNNGCTSIDGQGTINCGVGTTLMDCISQRSINFTNLSDLFVWSRTVNQQVSIVFTFDQQVNISRISMWFWNQPNDGIIVPMFRLDRSNDNFTTSDEVTFNTYRNTRDNDRQRRRQNFDIIEEDVLFQHLKIVMNFTDGSYIFLNEVIFCGKPVVKFNMCHWRVNNLRTCN